MLMQHPVNGYEAHKAFLEAYEELKETKGEQNPIYFIDATHPHHNPVVGYGWIKCGQEHSFRSNTGRRRLNINGAIDLIFLPPYSPNLNLIERFWKFFKKQVLYNQYYETFNEFKAACEEFFENPSQYTDQLRSLLTDNLQIIRI